jgi:hypothetical protein
MLWATLVGALVTWTGDAFAYRPFDGTDADVAELGHFELELGPVHWYSQRDAHYVIAPATVLNLGYAPGWELVVDFQNYVGIDVLPGQPRDQLLDTDILTKGVLIAGVLQDHGAGPSVAAEVGPLLPNVNGQESFGASCDVIVSERWRGLTAHVNSWFELTRGDLHFDWFEGIILEGDVDGSVRPVSEWYVERDFVTRGTTLSGLVGAIWRAHDDVDLDVGLREANVSGERATEVRLGLTWTIGVWKPEERAGRGNAKSVRQWQAQGPQDLTPDLTPP